MSKWLMSKILLVFFHFVVQWNRFRAFVGLLAVKHKTHGYFQHRGLPFTTLLHKKGRVDALMKYDRLRQDDILLLTYPKTGTHFTAEVLLSIYIESGKAPKKTLMNDAIAPLEMDVPQAFSFSFRKLMSSWGGVLSNLDQHPSPRIFVSHLPWNFLPQQIQEGGIKVIHCYRNPKDTLCSCYHFYTKMGLFSRGTSWQNFFYFFLNGTVVYGGYMDWLKQWYPHRNASHVLNIQFEDMKKDLRGSVKDIAQFLNIELTESQLENVVAANSFEKKKAAATGASQVVYRKGKSGGWKSDVTVEQNEILDEWIKAESKGMEEIVFQGL
ncbi:amine sulfotransferase-like [Watersipora subatra]|uniref:amine sulfotransferase-like n=1 Tax=Watersipora subatra TaxID=2589382 RepID=UPI00355C54AA